MKTYEHPYAIDKIVLNVRADFIERGIIDCEGGILDLQAFKVALVTSIKKPITIRRNEDIQTKLARGHDLLKQIRVYVVMNSKGPVNAGFRKSRVTVKENETLAEYVVQRDENEGNVIIIGDKVLTPVQQEDVFTALGYDLVKAQIFDDEPPAVSAALRKMLERR